MRVFRFMHRTELMKFMKGDKIHSYTQMEISFIGPSTIISNKNSNIMEFYTPKMCYEKFYKGVLTDDILVQFDIDKNLLTEGRSIPLYDPNNNKSFSGSGDLELISIKEYYIHDYDKNCATFINFEIIGDIWYTSRDKAIVLSHLLLEYNMTHLNTIETDAILKIMKGSISRRWTMKKDDFKRLKRRHISIS